MPDRTAGRKTEVLARHLLSIQSVKPAVEHSDVLIGARAVLEGNWREGRNACGLPYGYSCPDTTKYPDQFFWDSCFHALAWLRLDPKRAVQELRSLAAAQQPSGLIGHTTFWSGPCRPARAFTYNVLSRNDFQTASIQPPLLGFVWATVAARTGDARFAEEGREVVQRFHEYLDRERADADGLIGILQPDETGLDASPAYDAPLGWRSHPRLGFLALLAFNRQRGYNYRRIVADGGFHATDVLVNTAWILGWEGLAQLGMAGASERADALTRAMVRRLYDETVRTFFSEGPDGQLLRVNTWASLAPLVLKRLPPDIARGIANEHLLNPEHYWLRYPVPSTAASERAFVPGLDRYLWIERYWRGPTWLFSTWFVLNGLLRWGYEAEAMHMASQTVSMVQQEGFREYFNPITGEGYGAKRFGVSTIAVECAAVLKSGPQNHVAAA
jgi:hypothetical protein